MPLSKERLLGWTWRGGHGGVEFKGGHSSVLSAAIASRTCKNVSRLGWGGVDSCKRLTLFVNDNLVFIDLFR